MEVETGKILGWASTPSFDLNERNIKDYLNVPSEYLYEPGSVMKGITYAAGLILGIIRMTKHLEVVYLIITQMIMEKLYEVKQRRVCLLFMMP